MKKYEAMFVLDTAWAGKEWEPVEADLRKILERFGAQVEECVKWAERRLAYEIKKHKRAIYAHVLFLMDPERVHELRAHCGLDERILRLLILAFDPNAQKHLEIDERPGFHFGKPRDRHQRATPKPEVEGKPDADSEAAGSEAAKPQSEPAKPVETETPADTVVQSEQTP